MLLETATVLAEAVVLYRRYGFKEFAPVPGHAVVARCDLVKERMVLGAQLWGLLRVLS